MAIWLTISAWAALVQSPDAFSRSGAVGAGLILIAFSVVNGAQQGYTTQLFETLAAAIRHRFSLTLLRVEPDFDLNSLARQSAATDEEKSAIHKLTLRDLAENSDMMLDATVGQFTYWDQRAIWPRVLEVSSSVAATLQWGFGDWLLNRTSICGNWTC